jgi:hypothetical protein
MKMPVGLFGLMMRMSLVLHVVLQVLFAQVDLDGLRVAEAGARREHLERRVGAQELVALMQEDAHHRIDGLG